jgi:hypothetical protein
MRRNILIMALCLLATSACAFDFGFNFNWFGRSGGKEQIPAVSVSPSSYSFGNVTTTKSKRQWFIVTNTAKGILSNVSSSKTAGRGFSWFSTLSCKSATLYTGQYCRFGVQFATSVAGLSNYTTIVFTDQFRAPVAVALSGTGIAPPVTCVDQSCSGFLTCQNFETATTGLDNGPETWGTAQVGTGGSVTKNDTTATVLRGTQQLKIVAGNSGQNSSWARQQPSDNDYLKVHFKYRFSSALPSSSSEIFAILDTAGAPKPSILLNSGTGKLSINGTISTTSGLSPDTNYHIWVSSSKGTGANAVYTVAFSTTATEPTSGNQFATSTNGNLTNQIRHIVTFAQYQMTNFYDQILTTTSPTGVSPVCAP